MKQKSKSFESSKFILQDQKSEHMGTELWENWNASQTGIWRKPFMPQSIQTLYLSMASTFYVLYLLTNTSLYIITYYEFQYLIFNRFKTFWSGFLRCHFLSVHLMGVKISFSESLKLFNLIFRWKEETGGKLAVKVLRCHDQDLSFIISITSIIIITIVTYYHINHHQHHKTLAVNVLRCHPEDLSFPYHFQGSIAFDTVNSNLKGGIHFR